MDIRRRLDLERDRKSNGVRSATSEGGTSAPIRKDEGPAATSSMSLSSSSSSKSSPA